MAHDMETRLEEFKNSVSEQLSNFREMGEEAGSDAKDQLRKVRDALQERIEEIDNEIGSDSETQSAHNLMGGSSGSMSSGVGGMGMTSSESDEY